MVAIAGNTGRVKDAWEAFKRGSDQSPPVDRARRRFLTIAAGASAASVGTLAAAAMPATAPDSPAYAADPIYAVIQRHKEARAAYDAAVNVRGCFDDIEMDDERRAQLAVLANAVNDAYDRMEDAGADLVTLTLAGIVALCRYIEPLLDEDDTPNLPLAIDWDDGTASTVGGALANVIAAPSMP
jgi:hypothetical protein